MKPLEKTKEDEKKADEIPAFPEAEAKKKEELKKKKKKEFLEKRFRIPFTVFDIEDLKERSKYFQRFIRPAPESEIAKCLANSDLEITREEYLAICLKKFIFNLAIFISIFTLIFFLFKIKSFYLFGPLLGIMLSTFIYITELMYPKLYDNRKQRNLEKNLIPALQDMLVQLNAGVPLFNIMTNISNSDYKELSYEFKKAVKKINAGTPQLKVLEELGEKNSSPYFRRTLWQLSNGMRAGSDIGIVIKESIHTLTEEQLIQIQTYGNKLNPMIMFYMLIAVIIPALSVTFLTVIASIINLSTGQSIFMFIAIFFIVLIAQIMFLGIVKSIKPTLM